MCSSTTPAWPGARNLLDETEEEWKPHARGQLDRALQLLPGPWAGNMVEKKSGKVINVASTSGIEGEIGYTGYTTTKGGRDPVLPRPWLWSGLNTISMSMPIGPGWFHTPLTDPLTKDQVRFQEIMRGIPKGRLAQPAEIGPLAVFLASKASDFMTGSVVFMDGGQLAGIWP